MSPKILQWSFVNAVGTLLYVFLVTAVMRNGEAIFGQMKNSAGPAAFLLLFIISAAVTSSLVLGRPVLWYLDNDKKDAVKLFGATTAWLAFFLFTFIFIGLVF